jgi:hypothetical protein
LLCRPHELWGRCFQFASSCQPSSAQTIATSICFLHPLDTTRHLAAHGLFCQQFMPFLRVEVRLHLVTRLMEVQLTSDQDVYVWGLTASGTFLVKSMYLDYMNGYTKHL